jgi:hypothetical protein
MVSVKARPDSPIPVLTQLGLSDQQITVRFDLNHDELPVNAWGKTPADIQVMLGGATISIPLIHFDDLVLAACFQLSCGAPVGGQFGRLARAGQRLGNNLPRFAPVGTPDNNGVMQPGNNYIGLNIISPVEGIPYRFWYAYMTGPPLVLPLGSEKSVAQTQWRAIPYTQDPFGGSLSQPFTVAGTGAQNAVLFDNILDSP